MAALEPMHTILFKDPPQFSVYELEISEANFLSHICNELGDIFKNHLNAYTRLMNYSKTMENKMLNENFVRFLMEDILSTKEYTLEGISLHTEIPEDSLYEILIGRNVNPSLQMFRKIIELHRSIRKKEYTVIMKKILALYSGVES